MVTKNLVKQPKALVEVQVSVPWADIEPKWNETLQKLSAEVELPGFRKGQAPLNIVEQNLGSKLPDEVLKVVMPQALVEALQGTSIVPIDYPKYQVTSFTKGGQLNFSAVLTERPQVSVGDYKSIHAQRPSLKNITEEDVSKVIDELFRRWKAKAGSAAPAKSSDQPAGSSGSLSFNQQTNSAQPAQNAAPASPDDIFAQAMGSPSLNDLRTKIKTDLENEAKYNNELDFEEVILQEVEKITTVDIPDILVEDELNRMLVQLQRRVSDMGLLFEEYLKSQGKTLDGLKNEWKIQADKNVRMELGLAEIARMEGVDITDTELQAEIDKIQDARLKSQFEAQEPRLHLRHSLRQIKTLDLLKNLVKTA